VTQAAPVSTSNGESDPTWFCLSDTAGQDGRLASHRFSERATDKPPRQWKKINAKRKPLLAIVLLVSRQVEEIEK
jgi:hypothetical protein